jgi:hypothetical protein
MKRWLGAVHRGITYTVAGWTISWMFRDWLAAVRTQLQCGYALDRTGRPFNVWLMPGILVGILALLALGCLLNYIWNRKVFDAGRGTAQAITYPLPQPGARKRTRKRRRKK